MFQVLQHCSQADRLCSFALVSTAWNQAAAMATAAMSLDKGQCWNPDREFVPWLKQHGQHVTSLRYVDCDAAFRLKNLPCPNLKQLYVEAGIVQLGSRTPQSGILCKTQGLTSLELSVKHSSHIIEGYQGLTALQELPRLQQFDLAVDMEMEWADHETLPTSTLTGLTNLTRLSLRGQLLLDSLQFVSCLASLQEIGIILDQPLGHNARSADTRPFSQSHRLASVTLDFPGAAGVVSAVLASSSDSPAFAGCTALRELGLSGSTLDPSVLQGLSRLTALSLTGDQVPFANDAAVSEALAHISSMTGLVCLWLDGLSQALPEQHVSAYSALTASSQLQELILQDSNLTLGAWQRMFSSGRCARLRRLTLHSCDFGAQIATDGLQLLVRACPTLQTLGLHQGSHSMCGVALEPLLQLSRLTNLALGRVTTDASSVGVVARLTGLSYLWLAAEQLDDPSVLQLTALKQLTQLRFRLSDAAQLVHAKTHPLEIKSKVRQTRLLSLDAGHLATASGTVGMVPYVLLVLHSTNHDLGPTSAGRRCSCATMKVQTCCSAGSSVTTCVVPP